MWRDEYYTEKDKTKLLVALAIADCADGNGYAFPGVEYLAKKSRSTSRFVQIVSRELQRDGKLEIQAGKGRNGTNLYRLLGVKLVHPSKQSEPVVGVKPVRGEASSGRNGLTAEVTAEVSPQITRSVRNHQEPSGTKEKEAASRLVFPSELSSPAFASAWEEYIKYRKARKLLTLLPVSVALQLKKMAEWGEAAACEAIHNTISNSWQGLFQPKPNGFAPAKPSTPATPRETPMDKMLRETAAMLDDGVNPDKWRAENAGKDYQPKTK